MNNPSRPTPDPTEHARRRATPRASLTSIAALALLIAPLAACDPQQPVIGTTGADSGQQATPTTEPDAALAANPDAPPPRLTGFFDQGNFAILTVPPGPNQTEPQLLSIKSLQVEVELIGRMARTQVTQVFHNHTDRQTEGNYEFTLPAGAAISRLAMDVEGKMMEGELVEREKARQIYEQIVRSQKDPALLEWQGGERFKTQIFPIAANADKTVVLSYEQLLPLQDGQGTYTYSLPNLQGQPAGSLIQSFSFALRAEDALGLKVVGYAAQVEQRQPGGAVTFKAEAFEPAGPLEIAFGPAGADKATISYGAHDKERLFLVDFVPGLPEGEQADISNLVIALDTSAGIGKVELARAIELARALLAALPGAARAQIIHGDLKVRACAASPMPPQEAAACLDGLDAGGGTDLGALLRAAAEATSGFGGATSIVLLSDGSASLGELDGDLLQASFLAAIKDRPVNLHAVAIGHAPNEAGLGELARAARGHVLRMNPMDPPATVAVSLGRLVREPLLTDVQVTALSGKVEGLVPHRPVNLARGQSLAIMGRLDEGTARIEVRGNWQGQPLARTFDLSAPAKAENTLLPNFWARAVIEEMQDKAIDRDKIVATSLEYGVMSRYTSFLVLENEEAYQRFQIERRKEKERLDNQQQQANQQQAAQGNIKKGEGRLQDVLAKNEAKPDDPAPSDDEAPGEGEVDGKDKAGEAEKKEEIAQVMEPAASERRAENQPAPPAEEVADPAPALDNRVFKLDEADKDSGGDRETFALRPASPASKTTGNIGQGGGGIADGRLSGKGRGVGGPRHGWIQPDPQTYLALIKALEDRKGNLTLAERQQLMDNYVLAGQPQKARAFLKESLVGVDKEAAPQHTLDLLAMPTVRAALNAEFTVAIRARLKQPSPPDSLAREHWLNLTTRNQLDAAVADFSAAGLIPTTASGFLTDLLDRNQPQKAAALLDAWLKGTAFTKDQLYQILTNDRRLGSRVPVQLHALSAALIDEGDSRPEVMEDFAATAQAAGRVEQAAEKVLARCADPGDALVDCKGWLSKLASVEAVQVRIKGLFGEELKALQARRAQDMGNAELIRQGAALLEQMGNQEAALRLLSELVEFAPHDFGARAGYAQALIERKDIEGGCAQHAAAVQLNPSERDTFRTMMALRRQQEDKARSLRECIVQGVSKLPVHRAVSLVLTWEDPSADVDLHIVEVGGEEIYYSRRESQHGGLLYYDITDGFGPEIYVLGSGPAGEYALSLVYYSGSARNIKGTLTILRNAGAPDESREDREFVLEYSNSSLKIPIGVFRL